MATIAAVKEKRIAGATLFKWSLLAPLICLLLFLLPVFALQIYFALNSWTVYFSSWWEAEFVGFDQFTEVLTDARFLQSILRSFVFAGFSTLGCFLVGFGLALLMYRPFKGHGFFYAFFILLHEALSSNACSASTPIFFHAVIRYTPKSMYGNLTDRLSNFVLKPSG